MLEDEIVVVGAGGAGLAAAVSAAENGARVTVLEQRRAPGGSTLFAEGPFAAESPTQKRLNISCTKDELFNLHMYYNHWKLNARQVRTIINKSGDTIRWLEEKGIKFYVPPMFPNQSPLEWHNPKKGCPEIIRVFMKDCSRLKVQVIFDTRAKGILLDRSASISGLHAMTNGKDVTFKTRKVIIASGGYAGSTELLRKYSPYFNTDNLKANILENVHNGDGIQMAFDAGADSEGLGKLLLHGPVAQARSIFGLAIEADTVWVNAKGERFIQESASFSPFESANGVLRQPGQVMFSLFDEAIVQYAIRNGLERPFESSIHSSFDRTKLRLAIDDEIAKGNLTSAGSLDELAIKMGIDPANLKNNIEEYNSCCDRGHDDQLAKNRHNLKALRNPPYYATRCVPGILSSLGGIKTNHRMEVLDKKNNPIKGLYAAGNDSCGGFSGETYNVRLAGAGCGFAFNSGRIAGENAAKHAAK